VTRAWWLACLLVGCSPVTVDRYLLRPSLGPSPLPGAVAAVPEGEPAAWPYEEMAILQVVVDGREFDRAQVLEVLEREARLLGCTALVRVAVTSGSRHLVGTAVAVQPLPEATEEEEPELDK